MRAHLVVLATLLTAAPAHADNALRPERIPNRARELAEKGRKEHDAGHYPAAVSAFKEAYVLAPSPGLLFNIAQAYRLGGNCDEAAWMYRRFLDTYPRGPQRQLAETHLSAVEKCGNGGLRVSVTPPPSLDTPTPIPDSDVVLTTRLDRGDRRARTLKRAGLYTAVGGSVALIGAAVFAIDAHDAQASIEDSYKRGGTWKDLASIDARGQRSATIATALGVTGGAALLSAAVLYGLGHHYESSRRIAVSPTRGGAQVSLSWGF